MNFSWLAMAAPAQGGTTQQGNPLIAFMPIIIMFLIFYFLLIRPQQKQQKEQRKMIDNLKKGDEVITQGGLIGTIMGVRDNIVVLKLGEGDTKVECLKTAVSGLRKKD